MADAHHAPAAKPAEKKKKMGWMGLTATIVASLLVIGVLGGLLAPGSEDDTPTASPTRPAAGNNKPAAVGATTNFTTNAPVCSSGKWSEEIPMGSGAGIPLDPHRLRAQYFGLDGKWSEHDYNLPANQMPARSAMRWCSKTGNDIKILVSVRG